VGETLRSESGIARFASATGGTVDKTTGSRRKWAVEMRDELRRALNDVAPYAPAELTKTEMVRSLAPEIHGMKKKGYTLPAIAAFLTARGFPITTFALKSVLKEAPGRRRKSGRPERDGARAREVVRGERRDPRATTGVAPVVEHRGDPPPNCTVSDGARAEGLAREEPVRAEALPGADKNGSATKNGAAPKASERPHEKRSTTTSVVGPSGLGGAGDRGSVETICAAAEGFRGQEAGGSVPTLRVEAEGANRGVSIAAEERPASKGEGVEGAERKERAVIARASLGVDAGALPVSNRGAERERSTDPPARRWAFMVREDTEVI
jgi:hypothetical protein